jgi:azurin
MKKSFLSLVMAMFTVSFLVSCGGNEEKKSTTDEYKVTEAPAEAPAATIAVTVNADDAMKFDVKEITVYAGQEVTLTLNHVGKATKAVMGHNFVILKPGVVMADFAAKAAKPDAVDHIPAGSEGDIIAHTKMLGGGESDTINFTAPEKGEYDFLCSFPGHYAMMKGKFIVK